ncbi:unnamed protein product [Allacma fusca]|uniref:Uncharacterized protein n=1 Tax=Allacma fusca TaxID=39272 RepID=A0A8J2PBA5_9HEXA|nr:unnamed protein product [Allacma fusca]
MKRSDTFLIFVSVYKFSSQNLLNAWRRYFKETWQNNYRHPREDYMDGTGTWCYEDNQIHKADTSDNKKVGSYFLKLEPIVDTTATVFSNPVSSTTRLLLVPTAQI